MKRALLILVIASFALLSGFSSKAVSVKLLSANIGNSDILCIGYMWKLCLTGVEKRVTQSIREINADIVLLQEVVPAERCESKRERKPGFVCYDFDKLAGESREQARRILGPDYTIAVTKGAYEAIGVKKWVGHIKGCSDGSLCIVERIPIPAGCDPGFSITAIDVEIYGRDVRLINGHPDSISVKCRAQEVGSAFEAVVPGRTIMAGDWNLDPYRGGDKSVQVWTENLGQRNFHYVSGIAERNPAYHTLFLPLLDIPLKSLDHVVSDFAQGNCRVLGVSPGTKRLDNGFDLDHRALLCELEF